MTPEQATLLLENVDIIIGLLNDLVQNGNNLMSSIQFYCGLFTGVSMGFIWWMLAKGASK